MYLINLLCQRIQTKTFIHTSVPYKGLELLPKIIPLIAQRHPDAKFKIFSSMSLYGQVNDPYIEFVPRLKINSKCRIFCSS